MEDIEERVPLSMAEVKDIEESVPRSLAEVEDIEELVPQSLAEVVQSGCCSSCGACEGLLGVKARMVPALNGRLRPALSSSITAEEEARVLSVCPGARVGSPLPQLGAQEDPIVGPWISVRRGHAKDPEIRHKAAAGGGLTSLAIHLLESGAVDFILHVTPSTPPLQDYHARLSRTAESIRGGCGSRYAPSAPLSSIGQVLDLGQRFAFIGKPCDVNALCNLAEVDDRVDRLCQYKLTISCGSYPDPPSYNHLMEKAGIDKDEIEEFRYRGHGCPGWSPYIKARDGKEVAVDYVDFWYSGLPLTYQWRCKACPDFFGYQADVTVMDQWPGGPPEHHTAITKARAHERDGWVLLVARTPRGERLLESAEGSGVLSTSSAAVGDVLLTQPHQVTRAVGLWSRRLAHQKRNQPQPALAKGRRRLMKAAATDVPCVRAATEGNGVTYGAASGSRVLGAESSEEYTSMESEILASFKLKEAKELHPATVSFHVRNYKGCEMRIRRGDPVESVPLCCDNNLHM